jgi:hypothetical protein
MENAFDAKAKEVMSGKTTILSTSYTSSGAPAPNVLGMLAAPGEDTLKKTGVYTVRTPDRIERINCEKVL